MNTTKDLSEAAHIGIEQSDREAVRGLLAAVLADQHVLYTKTRNFHWNLTGPRFNTLHEFFEGHYGELEKAIDETAERIRMLGFAAPGSMGEFCESASLREAAGERIGGDEAISALLSDHESVVRRLREHIGAIEESHNDPGTADFLTGLLQWHEKAAWMLRSLQE